ncbi:MAG: Ig-like domain-containing protein [Thermoplasmata archaeon]|nr:Ig-like domain-containing protein [Thermoplasmata archaeon]
MALLTTTVPVLGSDDVSTGSRFSPPEFHTSNILVNLTYENGTPAEGVMVVYKNMNSHQIIVKNSNASGQAEFALYGTYWGIGSIKFKEGSLYQGYVEFFVEPDQQVYLDMVVKEVPAHVNTITGTVRNKTSGAVVPGVTVRVRGSDVNTNHVIISNVSDENGVYEVDFPNSTKPVKVEINFASNAEFFSHRGEFFLLDPPETKQVDIDLLPTHFTGPLFRAKFFNSTTDEIMETDYVNIRGVSSTYDLDSRYMTRLDSVGEWYQHGLPTGEYEYEWYGMKDLAWNVTFNSEGYFMINDTALDMELGIPVPEYAHLYVDIWNSTDPLSSTSVKYFNYFTDKEGDIKFYAQSYTGLSGKAHIGVPVGMKTEVAMYKPGYVSQIFTLEPTGGETFERNITLVKEEQVERPMGDVTIVVKDRTTGIPLPGAKVDGWGYNNDDYIYIGHGKNTNETGVFTGQIMQGDYDYLTASHNIGRGETGGTSIGSTNPEITIYVDRYSFYGDLVESWFTLVDSSGTPVSGVEVRVSPQGRNPGFGSTEIVSDSSGEVRFLAYPGATYSLHVDEDAPYEYRPQWASVYTLVIIPPSGGELEDLLVFPTSPLSSFHGFVRDSETMEVMPQVEVDAMSFHMGDDPNFNPFISEFWTDAVYLYEHNNGGTNSNGYYRTWGLEQVLIWVEADGYLPLINRQNMDTRSDRQVDILMDPIPDEGFWVNGSVVDQNGEPVDTGWVTATDEDRGGAMIPFYQDLQEGNQFSFYLWEGNFSLFMENLTIREYMPFYLTSDMDNVLFQIMPEFELDGTVTDWEGTPVEGLNVSLILHDEVEAEMAWTLTDAEGYYVFEGINMGDYTVRTELAELYDPYESETIAASGWLDINVPISLENRSVADVIGKVMGEGGPFVGGIPQCIVDLYQYGVLSDTTTSDENGSYVFLNVPYGDNYSVKGSAPAELQPVENVRSGYIENSTIGITVAGYEVVADVSLPYKVETPLGYLNITSIHPEGDDVPLDELIVIQFSMAVDNSTIDQLIGITPALLNLTYSWSDDMRNLTLEHDDMQPNTTYEIVFPSTALSIDGYPLHQDNEQEWNFTTGSSVALWRITESIVDFYQGDLYLTVALQGNDGMTVYLVVDGVGSFPIPAELGSYLSMVPISEFDWNTTYSYHFSSTDGGPDEAPAFSGTFTTPVNPAIPPGWDITEAVVTVDDDGDWTVEVTGEAGMDVYIVVDGVGSFQLEETEDGVYELTISGDEFDWEEDYSYHFSDSSGGDDLVPSAGGTKTTPTEPEGSDDDDDNLTQIAGICCLSMVIVLLLFVLIFVLISRRKRANRLDTEYEE